MTEPSALALRCRHLTKDHGEGRGLSPLDLEIAAGEDVALIGHNGSGKTTLIRMVAGLSEPSSGTLEVFGETPGSLSARAATSYLGDTPTFFDDLTVREHLAYLGGLHGVEDAPERGERLLERLGLRARGDDLPTRFSRGLRQKAAIALALVRPMRLLLVDEPFVGLDDAGRRALVALLDEFHHDGVTVIVATHDPELAARATRRIELADGVVMSDSASPRSGSHDVTVEPDPNLQDLDEGDVEPDEPVR